MLLQEWAEKWGINSIAIEELKLLIGTIPDPTFTTADSPEAQIQASVRVEASKRGIKLFRNNSGAGYLQDGSFVRWGLCNDSKRVNERFKSSDLIGIKPVLIQPQHVGKVLGQFIARETKRGNWKYRGTAEEIAQKAFIDFVIANGGDARFTNSPEGDL